MKLFRRLWILAKRWWRMHNRTARPVNTPVVNAQPPIDWFLWECEQYAKTRAPWFDHWRYEGTDLRYPDPTEAQRRQVWFASLDRATAIYGARAVQKRAEELAAIVPNTPLEETYFTLPDPWGWAMSKEVH